ncbi:Hypothetical predicted protein [Octopus vulgaris]|uniref:Acyl-coenzyme A thioesterase 8 n=1 Tax=Octopus vulgaris TaxID=6645 RepID=A0AA36AJB7_OCTVU|nr:Hypothetical predicted protein [Octopus vulgaris]
MLTNRVLSKVYNRLTMSLNNSINYTPSGSLQFDNLVNSRKYTSSETEVDYSSPQKFMESLGVKPGKYIEYALGVTNVEPGVFRGNRIYVHNSRSIAFGGLLLGQAANAACQTIPQNLYINSLHNYFINAGQREPLTLQVTNEREGKSYCNKTVCATQNEKTVIKMQIAFKTNEAGSIEHQWKMPECLLPEELLPINKIFEDKIREEKYKHLKSRLPIDPTVEFRPVDPEEMLRVKTLPPKRLTWVKQLDDMSELNQNWHRCVLLYMSDYILLSTSLLPNKDPLMKTFVVSLDHSVWFHNDINVNEWLLYDTESSYAGNGQSFNNGRFWSKDGTLLATVSQSGIVRQLKEASL